MNKIFILVDREPYEGDTIHGVYTTRENAEEALAELDLLHPHRVTLHLILAVSPDKKQDGNCAEAVG